MLYEGSYEAFARGSDQGKSSIYSPRPIGDRNFVFRNETLAAMADAEIAYARLDEQSTYFPYSSALRRLLANLEALSTICVDGVIPDLDTMFVTEAVDYARRYNHEAGAAHQKAFDKKKLAAAKAAIRYSNAVQRIVNGPSGITFDRDVLLNLHKELMYDEGERADVAMHFRQKPFRIRVGARGTMRNIYLAPASEEIPALIDDLMRFCNRKNLSPSTQAAVAHFHLEAIRPFKTGMDRTGRAFCHMIMRRRDLYRHMVPPIALVPAMNVPDHATLLFPYRTNKPFTEREAALALDCWTMHCANCLKLSVSMVRQFMRQITFLEGEWRARVPRIRKGSALDLILCELPGIPVITVATAMAITGKGFSAANDAVGQLVDAGVISPMSCDQRNRCFEAPEALDLIRAVTDRAIPTELTSRESVFS